MAVHVEFPSSIGPEVSVFASVLIQIQHAIKQGHPVISWNGKKVHLSRESYLVCTMTWSKPMPCKFIKSTLGVFSSCNQVPVPSINMVGNLLETVFHHENSNVKPSSVATFVSRANEKFGTNLGFRALKHLLSHSSLPEVQCYILGGRTSADMKEWVSIQWQKIVLGRVSAVNWDLDDPLACTIMDSGLTSRQELLDLHLSVRSKKIQATLLWGYVVWKVTCHRTINITL